MITKKEKHSNEYILTAHGNTWVRNFTKNVVRDVDINKLVTENDYKLILQNESKNNTYSMPQIDTESFFFPKVVIVSDGYGFDKVQDIIGRLPEDVAVFAANGALAHWKLLGKSPVLRNITFYIANNPYQDALTFLPRKHRYYPKCIASSRTNPRFLQLYHGNIYRYVPVPQENFGPGLTASQWLIDDYRNAVAASVCLAYKMEAYKILLMSVDDAYDEEKPGSIKVADNLWQYPAQLHSRSIVDCQCYWLKNMEDRPTQVGVYSPHGLLYEHVSYIANEEEVVSFFNDE